MTLQEKLTRIAAEAISWPCFERGSSAQINSLGKLESRAFVRQVVERHDKSVARRVVWLAGVLIVLLGSTVIPACSQDTVNEFWPEVDTYVTLSPKYRLFFMASKSVDQDSGQERWQFGPPKMCLMQSGGSVDYVDLAANKPACRTRADRPDRWGLI